MEEILFKISQIPKVKGVYLMGKDGLIVAKAGGFEVDEELIGVTGSEIYNLSEAGMVERFNMGDLDLITIESINGKFLMKKISDMAFLGLYTEKDINIGMLRIKLIKYQENLKDML